MPPLILNMRRFKNDTYRRETVDEAVSVGDSCRHLYLVLTHSWSAVPDVLGDTCVKQDRLLRDQADAAAEPLQVQLLHRPPIQRELHTNHYLIKPIFKQKSFTYFYIKNELEE